MVATLSSQAARALIGIGCVAVFSTVQADELWIAPTSQQDGGGLGIGSHVAWPVTPIGAVRLEWAFPIISRRLRAQRWSLFPTRRVALRR
jgi:hypothetical protein